MFKTAFSVVIAIAAIATHANAARAQFLDMSSMVQNELAFQNQFYNWAWQGSLQAAKHLRETGQQNPFNAMTIHAANNGASQAWEGYFRNSQVNSQRTSDAIGNYSTGAIRGQGTYYDPSTGAGYQLPWTQNQYHINQYGYAVPGYNPYRTNVYPYYGR